MLTQEKPGQTLLTATSCVACAAAGFPEASARRRAPCRPSAEPMRPGAWLCATTDSADHGKSREQSQSAPAATQRSIVRQQQLQQVFQIVCLGNRLAEFLQQCFQILL